MVGTFKRIAYKKLGSGEASNDIDTGEWTGDYDRLKVRIFLTQDSGNQNPEITFNNTDSGYGYKYGINNANGSDVNGSNFLYHFADDNGDKYITMDIINIKTKEKNVFARTTWSASGDNAPSHGWLAGKWSNTSSSIKQIELKNAFTGNFGVGSYIIVLGASGDTVIDEKETLADGTAEVNGTPATTSYGTSSGGSADNIDYTVAGKFTLSQKSKITSLGVRTKTAGQSVKICLATGTINGSDGVVLAQAENTNTVDGYTDVTIDYTAEAGDYWILAVQTATGISYPQFYTSSNSSSDFAYNNNNNYKTSNYSAAFNVGNQGNPLIKAQGSTNAGFRYTGYTITTVSTAPLANTRYEETDTRKIYRRTEAGEYLKVGTKWTPDSTTITYTGNTNTDNHGVSYDIGSSASDTWVLRFEHTVTSTIGTTNGDVNVFCGLSDKDMNTTHQQNQDWIGVRLMLSAKSGSNYGLIRPNSSNDGSPQGGAASSNYGYMGSGTENTKFYIEIIRTSSSAYTISISNGNDYNGDVLSATGGSTSATALRYIKFGDQANTSSQPWDGKIENVQFWDNTTSAGGGTEVAIAKAEWKERGTA